MLVLNMYPTDPATISVTKISFFGLFLDKCTAPPLRRYDDGGDKIELSKRGFRLIAYIDRIKIKSRTKF